MQIGLVWVLNSFRVSSTTLPSKLQSHLFPDVMLTVCAYCDSLACLCMLLYSKVNMVVTLQDHELRLAELLAWVTPQLALQNFEAWHNHSDPGSAPGEMEWLDTRRPAGPPFAVGNPDYTSPENVSAPQPGASEAPSNHQSSSSNNGGGGGGQPSSAAFMYAESGGGGGLSTREQPSSSARAADLATEEHRKATESFSTTEESDVTTPRIHFVFCNLEYIDDGAAPTPLSRGSVQPVSALSVR